MHREVIDRLVQDMRREEVDAVIAISPENFSYVTGCVSPTQSLMRWRHAMALVKVDGSCALVVVDMEESTIRARMPAGVEIAVWREFHFDAMTILSDVLHKHGLAKGRIGIETDYIPVGDMTQLHQKLPGAEFRPIQSLLARLRQIKTAREIELLRRLSRIADQSLTEAYQSVGAGSTEMDLAAALTRYVYRHGAEQFKLMIVATGERSVFPNVGPTTRVLKNGDVCRLEIFPMIDGYHAGVCRTAAVGAPPPEAKRIWAKLTDCKRLLLDVIKPGARTSEIYKRYLDKVSDLGLPPISFIGHGIGLHLHEDPYLGPKENQPLEAGMVLAIEPLIYETGYGFGMQNKDMVLVTETGCELLSDFTNTDDLFVIASSVAVITG